MRNFYLSAPGASCQLQLPHFGWPTRRGEALTPAALLSQIKLPLSAAPLPPSWLSCAAGLLCGGLQRSGCLWRWFPLLSDTSVSIRYTDTSIDIKFAINGTSSWCIITHCLLPATCNATPLLTRRSSANTNRSTSHYTLYTLYTMWGLYKKCVFR